MQTLQKEDETEEIRKRCRTAVVSILFFGTVCIDDFLCLLICHVMNSSSVTFIKIYI